MEEVLSLIIYVGLFLSVLYYMKKKSGGAFKLFGDNMPPGESGAADRGKAVRASGAADRSKESGAMPHRHRESEVYDTYNRRNARNDSGAMPHKHEKRHYTSMADASKLPPGYILLNGEPVRVADLEGK